MKKHVPELLAPAGGPPEFNAALAAGADAVYCGFGNTFNARRGAQSFTSQTFGEACRVAHIVGARVYVTVNVAIRSDEMPVVLALVRRAWLLGADAFIVQDWGLLQQIRTRWPHIECHVSTQANVHDARGVAWCGELGAHRVTLSRELSLAEIARIAQEGVELECFCHGAICICYSGVCQMSSSAGTRSANRGMCAQPCRLPYDLVDGRGEVLSAPGRGRPLCPKDFYAFDDLDAMIRAGVDSLKVEGRLKGPDYIVSVISAYREQLDEIGRSILPAPERDRGDTPPNPTDVEARKTRLKRAFNRDFTKAYLYGTSGDELMSYERSNNRGELVGTVCGSKSFGSVKVRRGGSGGGRNRLRTAHIAQTDILLNKPVSKGDLLEVRPVSDPSQFLTAHVEQDAAAGETISCRTTRPMEEGSLVRVIRNQWAMNEGARAASLEIPRKREVHVRVRARLGDPFEVELFTIDGEASAAASGFVVEPARTRAVEKQDLIAHVGRMGSSFFDPVSFEVELDKGCGMSFSAVHGVRARACELLEESLLAPYAMRKLPAAPSRETILADLGWPSERAKKRPAEICAVVASADAVRAAFGAGATRVYAIPEVIQQMASLGDTVVPVLDEVCREGDHERLDCWVKRGAAVAVGNVSELALARERGACAEIRSCIPVHNESCLRALQDAGATGVWLSAELSLEEIATLASKSSIPVGLTVIGRTRAMTTEHCVLQVADTCVHNCAACKLRKTATYLRNGSGDLYPVGTDLQGRSRVYSAYPLDATPQLAELYAVGVSRFAVDGTLMSTDELARNVRRVVRAVAAVQRGDKLPERMPGHTSGHLFEPIA